MLKIRFVILLCVFIFIFGADAFSQTPTPDPIERVATEEIKLHVLAFDKNGDFATKLALEDLVINEDGQLIQAQSVRSIPANVLLVLDVGSEISYAKRNHITARTARALINSLQPNDSVAAMQYGDKVEVLTDWTRDKIQLARALGDRKLGFGKHSMFDEAMNQAIEFFNRKPLENRHLVLITDGVDSFSNLKVRATFIKNLLSSDINVHVISYTKLQQAAIGTTKTVKLEGGIRTISLPPGAGMPHGTEPQVYAGVRINLDREMSRKRREDASKLEQSEKFLTEIAEDTNGEIFLPDTTDEMIAKTTILAKNIDSQYIITYIPKRPLETARDGETRIIKITSRSPGLEIQGRRKFIVLNDK